MKFINLFENFNMPNYNLSDIEDVFRDLDEENDIILVEHIPYPISGIFKEFVICKPNKDGRQFITTLGGRRINLEKFDLNIFINIFFTIHYLINYLILNFFLLVSFYLVLHI